MSNPDTREPAPWAPEEYGAFIVQLGADNEPFALHTFVRQRGTEPREIWNILTVCELREVDPMSPSGWIAGDGGFNFWLPAQMDDRWRKALIAFIEATDPRLHLDENDEWTFTFE